MAEIAAVLMAIIACGYALSAHQRAKKYKNVSEDRYVTITSLYEQIYIAQRLTGFVNRLKNIDKKHPSHKLRLTSIINDFDYYIEVVDRTADHRHKRQLTTLDNAKAKDELENLSRNLRKLK